MDSVFAVFFCGIGCSLFALNQHSDRMKWKKKLLFMNLQNQTQYKVQKHTRNSITKIILILLFNSIEWPNNSTLHVLFHSSLPSVCLSVDSMKDEQSGLLYIKYSSISKLQNERNIEQLKTEMIPSSKVNASNNTQQNI